MPYWTPEEAIRAQYQRYSRRQPLEDLYRRPATVYELAQREQQLARMGNRGELSPFWNRAVNRLIGGHAAVAAAGIAQSVNKHTSEWAGKRMRPRVDITGGVKPKKVPKPSVDSSLFGKKVDKDRQAIYDRWKKANEERKSMYPSVPRMPIPEGEVPRRPRGGPGRDSENDGARAGSSSGRKIYGTIKKVYDYN